MDNFVFRAGEDCVWIASDKEGYLGAFVTAGEAPIFAEAVRDEWLEFYEIESSIIDLPISSDCEIFVFKKHPEDFLEMAKRGFFVYDWLDTCRTKLKCSGTYELISAPRNPLLVTELPEPLQKLARNSILTSISFKEKLAINPLTDFV